MIHISCQGRQDACSAFRLGCTTRCGDTLCHHNCFWYTGWALAATLAPSSVISGTTELVDAAAATVPPTAPSSAGTDLSHVADAAAATMPPATVIEPRHSLALPAPTVLSGAVTDLSHVADVSATAAARLMLGPPTAPSSAVTDFSHVAEVSALAAAGQVSGAPTAASNVVTDLSHMADVSALAAADFVLGAPTVASSVISDLSQWAQAGAPAAPGLLPTLAGQTSANGSEGLQLAAGRAPSSVSISDFSQLGNTAVSAAASSMVASPEPSGGLHPGLPLAATLGSPLAPPAVSEVISLAALAAGHQAIDTVASRIAGVPNALHLAAPTASSGMMSDVIHSATAAQLADRAPVNSIFRQSGALSYSVPVAPSTAPANSLSDLTHIAGDEDMQGITDGTQALPPASSSIISVAAVELDPVAQIKAATTAPSSIVSGITDLALAGGLAQQPDRFDTDPGADLGVRAATTAPSSIVSGVTDLATAGRLAQHADIAPDGADVAAMRHFARYVLAA